MQFLQTLNASAQEPCIFKHFQKTKSLFFANSNIAHLIPIKF